MTEAEMSRSQKERDMKSERTVKSEMFRAMIYGKISSIYKHQKQSYRAKMREI